MVQNFNTSFRTEKRSSARQFKPNIWNLFNAPPTTRNRKARHSRKLRLEQLEERTLLSVSPVEYAQIQEAYPHFNLPELQNGTLPSNLNIIEIEAANLSVASLKNAIATAATTASDDLIVLRTTNESNRITFASAEDEIAIYFDSSQYGKLSIVGLGTKPLTIDANELSRVMSITSTTAISTAVNLGNLTITGGKCSGNGAGSNNGGGIYKGAYSSLTVTNCMISGNTASDDGGGIYNANGTLTITNSTISGNTASDDGGGISNSGALTITNSTISGNIAYESGGIYNNYGTLNLYNTIVAKNSTDIYKQSGSVTACNNLIGNGTNSGVTNATNGNIVGTKQAPIDPLLGELTEFASGLKYCPLLSGSPAIGTGDIRWIPANVTTDQRGNSRTTNGTVCIGAVEGVTDVPRSGVTYTITTLDEENLPEGGYTFFEALEAANYNRQVGAAQAGSFSEQDKIVFADGLTGTIYLNGKQLEILGSLMIDASAANITFDAQEKSRVMYIGSGIDVSLNHSTLTGGTTSADGGGICNYSMLTITNSTISGNTAKGGGGICNYSTLTIINSTISGNTANYGGGIYNSGPYSVLTITNCTILGNSAVRDYGGGIFNSGNYNSLTITNSTISGNSAKYGGGIYNSGSYSALTITNSTISGNSARYYGGGINGSSGTINAYNTIIVCNTAENGTDIRSNGTINGYNSLSSYTAWGGENNYVYDPNLPLFRSVENGDYRLAPGSQAADKGNNQYAYDAGLDETSLDMAGKPRFIGENIDIGAYQSSGIGISQHSIYIGDVTLRWEQYKNTANVRLTWVSGTSTTVLGNFESAGEYVWNSANCDDGYGQLKVEFLDENGKAILTSVFAALILNDQNIIVHRNEIAENQTWGSDQVHLVVGRVNIKSGAAVTIAEGAVVKFWQNSYLYNESGASLTIGANATLTRAEDDTVGGDTNKDGELSVAKMGNSYIRGTGTFEMVDSVRMKFVTTTTSGAISADQTWFSGQVYHVTGTLTVNSGATLTILPGAIVKFNPGCSLIIQSGGRLVAEGNVAQPIVFTSAKDDSFGGDTNEDDGEYGPQAGDWNQIRVDGGSILFNHVILRYAGNVSGSQGAIYSGSASSSIIFNNSLFEFSKYYGISLDSGIFTASNSVFRECQTSVFNFHSSSSITARITNCTIGQSSIFLWCGWGDTIFQNCVVFDITSKFVGFDDTAQYLNCIFYNLPNSGPQTFTHIGTNNNIWANPLFRDAANGDYHLMAGSPCIDAADGMVATLTDITGAPRYTDVYSSQSGTPNVEGVYVDIGAYEFTDSASSSINLEPVNVQAPASATVGETVTIQWTIRNNGTVAATGAWTDAIYLVNIYGQKILVKDVIHYGNIAAGDLQTFYAEVVVPTVTDGDWSFAVHVNPNREIFEGINIDNNFASTTTATSILSPLWTESTAAVALSEKALSKLYRLEVPAGQTLFIQGVSEAQVSIRVSADRAPTAVMSDYSTATDGTGNYSLFVPASETARTYFMLVSAAKPASVSISMSHTAFSITNVTQTNVSNFGTSTIGFIGAGFDSTLSVKLKQGSREIIGTNLSVHSGSSASAKFDLTGIMAGSYDLVVTKNSLSKTLENAVTVAAGGVGAVLNAWLTIPDSIRAGRVYSAKITYSNEGDCDMYLPIFVITGGEGNLLGTNSDNVTSTTLNVLGVGSSDSAGILRPGEEYSLTFYFKATDSACVSFTPVTSDDDYIGNGTFNTAYWSTWSEFYADLSGAVTQLHARGNTTTSYSTAKMFLYAQKAGEDTTGVSGYLQNAVTGEAISDCRIYASWNNGEDYTSCVSDESGRYVFNYLPQNTTILLSLEETAYNLSVSSFSTVDHDITDFNLTALPYGSISGRITNENSQSIAGILVMAFNDSGNYGYTFTDKYGQYTIGNLQLASYSLSVESAGIYQNVPDQTIEITGTPGLTRNLSLIAGTGYVSHNSITESECAAIRQTYDSLIFPELLDEVNVIEIAQNDISALNLIRAIYISSKTESDDLILLQSTEDTTINLNGYPIQVNIDAEQFGTVSIVNAPDGGDVKVAVNSGDAATIYISQGTLQLANVDFINIATDDNWSQLGRICTIEGTTDGKIIFGDFFTQDVSCFDHSGNDIMETYFMKVIEEDGSIAYYEKEMPQNSAAANLYDPTAYTNSSVALSADNQNKSENEVNNYVIIFSGGMNKDENYPRYYENVERLYKVCKDKYKIPTENIFVLYADGRDPGKDKKASWWLLSWYVNSDMSFVTQNLYSASKSNLESVCNTVSGKMKEEDHLLVYTYDHGAGKLNNSSITWEESLMGWNDEYISDVDFARYMAKFDKGYVTYVLSQCFSGGMLDNISIGAKEFGMAAANHYEASYGGYFSGCFIKALASDNYDDGKSITGQAAFTYAKKNDPMAADHEYEENGGKYEPVNYFIDGNPLNKYEHPWSTGADFPIFAKTSMLDASVITVTGTTTNSISTEWTKVEFANQYYLQISTSPNFASCRDYVSTLTSTTFTGLKESTAYYIRMKATDTTGERKDSQWSNTASARTAKSEDPNEINGPVGYDFVTVNTGTEEPFLVITTPNWIQDDAQVDQGFKIYFKNKSSATAAAQEVFVTTTLPEEFNWDSFTLSEICIGNQIFNEMVGYTDGVWTVNQTSTGDQIQISVTMDYETGTAKWYLRSWVATTADNFPTDAYDGFLPPNNKETHDGEGYVSFTVRMEDDLASGTRIETFATIVFDTNEPIVTNTWVNTIDETAPTSEIVSTVYNNDNEEAREITVVWSGTDEHSGIAFYDVYYSTDGGEYYEKWLDQTTDTTSVFSNPDKNTIYTFKVIAYDNVGNTNSGVTAKIEIELEHPSVQLNQSTYAVQEGCSVYISGAGSTGTELTYWWDLSGTGNGKFVEKAPAFWLAASDIPAGSEGYTIRLKVADKYGIESRPVSVTIQVDRTAPSLNVHQTSLLNGQVVKLQLNASCYGGRAENSG